MTIQTRGFMSFFGYSSVVPPSLIDPIALQWRNNVLANNGTVATHTLNAVDTAIKSLRQNTALWNKINNGSSRFSLMAGTQLEAALVPILKGGGGDLDIVTNVVSGDYNLTDGISGNGSNKRISLEITPTQAGQTQSDTCVMFIFSKDDDQAISMHWSDEANKEEGYTINGTGHMAMVQGGVYRESLYNTDSTRGIWGVSVTNTAMQCYRNGRARFAITQGTTDGSQSVSGKYTVLARGSGTFESLNAIGGYYIGTGLLPSELHDLIRAMETFCATIGRPITGDEEKIPLLAFGDSMTAGAGSTGGTNGWPVQYYNLDTTRMVLNAGVSGENADLIHDRFIFDPRVTTDVVTIMAGTNDYQGGAAAVTSALGSIAAMVNTCIAAGNEKYVVCTPFGSFSDTVGTADHGYLLDLCNGIIAAYPNNYVDTRTAVINAYDSGSPTDVTDFNNNVTPTSLRADDPHLNDAGYTVVRNAIFDFIEEKGWIGYSNRAVRVKNDTILQANTTNYGGAAGAVGNFTFGGWFRIDSYPERYVSLFTLFSSADPYGSDSYFWFGHDTEQAGGNTGLAVLGNLGAHCLDLLPATGTWFHAAVAKNGTSVKVYLNGSICTWDQGGTSFTVGQATYNQLDRIYLCNEDAADQDFDGAITGCFFTNSELSQAEIQQMMTYHNPDDHPSITMVHSWPLRGAADLDANVGQDLVVDGTKVTTTKAPTSIGD